MSVEKIRDNLYLLRVEIPIPSLKFVNVYAFKSSNGGVIIDTGWDSRSSLESFLESLSKVGMSPKDLRKIIITHFHMDHLGLSRRVRNLTNAEIILHEKDREVIKRMISNSDKLKEEVREVMRLIGLPRELYENVEMLPWIRMLKSYEEVYNYVIGVKDEEEIYNGEYQLRLIWTPGHTPGHLCVYEPNLKFLFSGDHILPRISSNVSQFDEESDALGNFLKSLVKIKSIEVEKGFPAHQFEFDNIKGRVNELIEHHYKRLNEILEAMENGKESVYEIASSIKWRLGGKSWEEADPLQKYFAIGETISHLVFLKKRGLIEKYYDEEGRVKYRIKGKESKEELEIVFNKCISGQDVL